MIVDILAGLSLTGILGGAIAYIVKSKKSGKKCIGCPDCCSCPHNGPCHSQHRDHP